MKWFVRVLLIFLQSSKSLQLGWLVPCLNNEDCVTLKNASCVDGLCSCGSNFYVCGENLDIIKVNSIGGECNNVSRICNSINSQCGSNKTCVCKKGFLPSDDSKRCLKGLGEECISNEDCSSISFSSCINFKCSCTETHVAKGFFKCLSTRRSVGEFCEDDVQCTSVLGIKSQCSNGVCNCNTDYHYSFEDRICVKNSLLGEVCGSSKDCHQPGKEYINQLMCIEGVCKCRLNYTEEKGYCIDNNAASTISFKLRIFLINMLSVYFYNCILFRNCS